MKLLITLLLAAGAAQAQPLPDAICLPMGQLAHTIADARQRGFSEEKMLVVVRETYAPGPAERAANQTARRVVQLVFALQLAPASARRLAYLECKTGSTLVAVQ